MLYKLSSADGRFTGIERVAFRDFADVGQLEKDLENLIAQNLLDMLFEEAGLMPVSQEQQGQQVADIYALNEIGELTIFELKRSRAGADAVHQALGYAQAAGQWSYSELQARYQQYSGSEADLAEAHREAFGLDRPLQAGELNCRQHLMVVGSAADESLVSAVDYWRRQGISVNFLPYRVYDLAGEQYFEFFALPYDRHRNPADEKGVLFDTNRTYDENSIWYMMENNRVAAFGEAKRFVASVNVGDIVFFSHGREGVVAAATVRPGSIRADGEDILYRDVEFVTPVPQRGHNPTAMPFGTVGEVTGKRFFWARTNKYPYLSKAEAKMLVDELRTYLERAG